MLCRISSGWSTECGIAPRFYIARFTVERVRTGVLDRPEFYKIRGWSGRPIPTRTDMNCKHRDKLGFGGRIYIVRQKAPLQGNSPVRGNVCGADKGVPVFGEKAGERKRD